MVGGVVVVTDLLFCFCLFVTVNETILRHTKRFVIEGRKRKRRRGRGRREKRGERRKKRGRKRGRKRKQRKQRKEIRGRRWQ